MIFITGGASGLGLALVRAACARGYDVCVTGRRTIAELPTDFPDVPYLPCDLGQQSAAIKAAEWVMQGGGAIGCAILNAGTGHYRPLAEETPKAIAQVLSLNLEANVILAHRLCPAMSGGTLALIGSVAYKGAARMPVYSASKAALDGFGRALAEEWRGRTRVRVLHPGPIATGMAERAGRAPDFFDKLFVRPQPMAEAILDAALARSGRDRQVISWGRVAGRRFRVWPRKAAL